MKIFVVLALVAQAAFSQTYAQCIRPVAAPFLSNPVISAPYAPFAPAIIPSLAPQVVVSDNVASNLADTLSLLTVSSLLAETLPYGPQYLSSLPVNVGLGGCGGCGGCGACGGYYL